VVNQWNNRWANNQETYNPYQVETVLHDCGIEVSTQTYTAFLCYCPYHSNRDTPSFAVNKTEGTFICFNPSCGETGNLFTLLRDIKGLNTFEAKRAVRKRGSETERTWNERVIIPDDVFVPYPQETVDTLVANMWSMPEGRAYLHGRHLDDDTIKYFSVGYDGAGKVTIPLHSPFGELVGLVGRSVSEKRFKNSDNLPISKTLFNIHRARAHDSVIIVESAFCAMRLHQAGYPNAVATLHGHMSSRQFQLLGRYFDTIINMTDYDEKQFHKPCGKCKRLGRQECIGHSPGRDLGAQIAAGMQHKKVLWAAMGDRLVYPTEPLEGYRDKAAKDPSDMSDAEIHQCLRNAVSNYEYSDWFRVDDVQTAMV